jgi:hypothetical protein
VESEILGFPEVLHAPKVDVVANHQSVGIAPSSTEPWTTPEDINKPTNAPEPLTGVPSRVATERTERGEDLFNRGISGSSALIDELGATGPTGVCLVGSEWLEISRREGSGHITATGASKG